MADPPGLEEVGRCRKIPNSGVSHTPQKGSNLHRDRGAELYRAESRAVTATIPPWPVGSSAARFVLAAGSKKASPTPDGSRLTCKAQMLAEHP